MRTENLSKHDVRDCIEYNYAYCTQCITGFQVMYEKIEQDKIIFTRPRDIPQELQDSL